MHHATIDSPRLQRYLKALIDAGPNGLTGYEWAAKGATSPGTIRSELNKALAKAGRTEFIGHRYEGTRDDDTQIHRYYVTHVEPRTDLFGERATA